MMNIYVVGADDGPVKIGRTEDVVQRLAQLQLACPDELFLHYHQPVPFRLGAEIEIACHRALAGRRLRGEWFDVTAREAREVVQRVAAQVQATSPPDPADFIVDDLDRLVAQRVVNREAPAAVSYYRQNIHSLSHRDEIRRMDALMREQAGREAVMIFRLVIVERKLLMSAFSRHSQEFARAQDALTRAVAVLAYDYSRRRKMGLLKHG